MTQNSKKLLLNTVLAINCLLLIFLGAASLYLLLNWDKIHFDFKDIQHWWIFSSSLNQNKDALLFPYIGLCLLVFSAFTQSLFLRLGFFRSASSELFFLNLFLFTLTFESLRVLQILLQNMEINLYFAVLISRIIIFSRFFALFSLFGMSLFPANPPFRKVDSILAFSFIISFSLAYLIPVNSGPPYLNMLHPFGRNIILTVFFISLEILTIANYIRTAIIKSSANYLYIAFAILLIVSGMELLYFSSTFIHITLGPLLFNLGIVLALRRIHLQLMWV